MKKVLESNATIRFQDCDPFNHLNNSKYVDYFINAREDQVLEHYGLDIYKHVKTTGKAWVVTSNQISYLKPAFLMENVVIESQLIQSSDSTLKVEMKMWDKNKTALKSIFWTTFTYFNMQTMKKEKHEPELIDLFNKVINPIDNLSFEERYRQILNKKPIAV